MFVLDPDNTSKSTTKYEGDTALLPEHWSQFKFVPNPGDLRPADAILTSPKAADFGQNEIRQAQADALGWAIDNEHVQWTHVAVSIKDWEVVEAVVPKIKRTSMLERSPDYTLRSRRVPSWTDNQRNKFAKESEQRLGQRYDRITACMIWGYSKLPKWAKELIKAPSSSSDSKEKICSTLYADVYMIVTDGGSLWPEEGLEKKRVPLPADISRSSVLEDVHWNWLCL
jgi:hypothetical protein